MKIWQLRFELDKYDNLMPLKEFTVEELQSFDGRSHLKNWSALAVKRMEPEKGLELGDAPGFHLLRLVKNLLQSLLEISIR